MVGLNVLFSEATKFGSDSPAKNNSCLHLLYLLRSFLYRLTKKCIHTCVDQTTTAPLPFSLTVLPFYQVALAIIWLAPSFERVSHYAPYSTCWFNVTSVKMCIHYLVPSVFNLLVGFGVSLWLQAADVEKIALTECWLRGQGHMGSPFPPIWFLN
jgi:hypothetical protein